MGQDLKEIIDRLNSSNTKPDPDDPVSATLPLTLSLPMLQISDI
jgi:hypothetical protein